MRVMKKTDKQIKQHMSNVNGTQDLSAQLKSNPTVCAQRCLCVSEWLCSGTYTQNAWAQWRDGDKGCPAAAHSIRWGRLRALIQSIYLGLTLICRDAACQTASGPPQSAQATPNCFSFGSSAVTTAVQRFGQSSSKISAIRSSASHARASLMRLSCCQRLSVNASRRWHVVTSIDSRLFEDSSKVTGELQAFLLRVLDMRFEGAEIRFSWS